MSMEKNKARREQIDATDLDPQNNATTSNENYRVAVTNHLVQVCIKFLNFFAIIKFF